MLYIYIGGLLYMHILIRGPVASAPAPEPKVVEVA